MKRPALMGIVNVTPDSFSDGGKLGRAAVLFAESLVVAGADILDIGAESTRPGAELLSPEQEWERLGPVLAGIYEQSWRQKVRLSVDTRHAETARRALALGVDIINDVSACADADMANVLREQHCDIVVMHALGIPADPETYAAGRLQYRHGNAHLEMQITATLAAQGIAPERVIFDAGIGFGKTALQSLTLIAHANELVASHGRWLFGHSRKSFMKAIADVPPTARDDMTRVFSAMLAESGVDYLRVHDVAGHCAMLDALCTEPTHSDAVGGAEQPVTAGH